MFIIFKRYKISNIIFSNNKKIVSMSAFWKEERTKICAGNEYSYGNRSSS